MDKLILKWTKNKTIMDTFMHKNGQFRVKMDIKILIYKNISW